MLHDPLGLLRIYAHPTDGFSLSLYSIDSSVSASRFDLMDALLMIGLRAKYNTIKDIS